ncbi:MAG TPA: isoprenylcysteine carboxylmethyltransferase family protein [Steroidobacteraceae bacterium]|jgi:protein-S-isoprenylcysteine O-methyltransferase Ste14|nr:isoprenylcysteine carboxylmethyltransferase family protein [Steroidobacteraceae bacterium]
MTRSASTPRLRLILLWYLIVIIVVVLSERPWSRHWSGQLAAIAGLLLIAAAALGRIWCSAFIAGYKDAELVTSGPYSLCRNPLYGFSMLAGVGVGLASASVILLASTVTVLAVLHARAVRSEERTLLARHGAAFRSYCARVPRFVPRHWRAPSTSTTANINVTVFWKSFLDAGSLFLLYAAIVTSAVLQRAWHWPTAFVLW